MSDTASRYEEILKARFAEKLRRASKQSTYTEENAKLFQAIFDKLLETHETQCIPYKEWLTYSPETLLRKVYNARRWLSENGAPEIQRKYSILKLTSTIKMSQNVNEGIFVVYRGARNPQGRVSENTKAILSEIKEAMADTGWKENFLAFIENGTGMLNLTNLALTQDDIAFVENICEGALLEYKVNTTMIRVVK